MDALGINIVNIIIYIILFILLYLVLDRLILKSFFENLDKRKEEINRGLELSKEAEAKINKFDSEKRVLITQIKNDHAESEKEIIQEATKEAEDIINKAKKEAHEIIEKANTVIDVEKAKLQREMDAKIHEKVNLYIEQVYKEYKVEIDKANLKKILED